MSRRRLGRGTPPGHHLHPRHPRQFSALYDEVQRDGWGRVDVVSLPALFATAEGAKPVFRLLHNTTSRVRRGNGIGFYVVGTDVDYPGFDDDTVLQGISPAFDDSLAVDGSDDGFVVEREPL